MSKAGVSPGFNPHLMRRCFWSKTASFRRRQMSWRMRFRLWKSRSANSRAWWAHSLRCLRTWARQMGRLVLTTIKIWTSWHTIRITLIIRVRRVTKEQGIRGITHRETLSYCRQMDCLRGLKVLPRTIHSWILNCQESMACLLLQWLLLTTRVALRRCTCQIKHSPIICQ